MKPDIRIGPWVFTWAEGNFWSCPKCGRRDLLALSVLAHMDAHEALDRAAAEQAALPGQMGIHEFGVADVPKEKP